MPRRTIRGAKKKLGLSPGTLVYLGSKEAKDTKLTIFDYDVNTCEEIQTTQVSETANLKTSPTVSWINIDGLREVDVIKNICENFAVHTLAQEDIVNTGHRPKMDDFDDQLFIVLKMVHFPEDSHNIRYEHISLVVGENYLLSFQEAEGDVFKPIRERIRGAKGRLRKLKSDYLAYSLIDTVVDNYFLALEKLEDQIEALDNEVLNNASHETLLKIHSLKLEVNVLRKAVWPLREVVYSLQKGDSKLIKDQTTIFLKDLYDHVMHVIDAIDNAKENLSGLTELYMSGMSNKMNEIMKVLTVMASIFIPLTFIAGIYGMNFEYMPELKWKYGYFGIWALMLSLSGGLIYFLKKKNWF